MNYMDPDDTAQDPNQEEPPHHHEEGYGFMEREVAFKLIAAHAMVDAPYFDWLRKDPVAAAADLHIALSPKDIDYLENVVEWDRLAEIAEPIRGSLHLDVVTNSW
jgi:hypothetical protein